MLFLCCCSLLFISNLYGQNTKQEEQYASTLLSSVENESKFVEELTINNLTNLPVGIKKTVSNITIVIAIDSARLTPSGMLINAFAQFKFPGTSSPVTFVGKNILVTPAGISSTTASRLVVISETVIPINDVVSLIIPADGRNFIEWDCYGFRSVSFGGLFEFASDYFIPDPVLSKNKTKVTAGFEIVTSDLNNILISTSIDPFRIASLGDFTFVVTNATADMSDFANPPGFVVPSSYNNLFPDAPQLWRGFYLKELTVLLPPQFSDQGKRSSVSAENLLLDEFGISGIFKATGVLPIERGNASGWPFSVEMISVGITRNRLTAGVLSGALAIPFLGNDTIGYHAQIISDNSSLFYNFSIETNTDKIFQVPFGGTVKLERGCVFELSGSNGKFIPSAILNGSLSVQKDPVKFNDLRFEGLHLTAESPYILGGTFESSASGGINIAGFGTDISNITLGIISGKAFLGMDVKLSLMSSNEKGVSASTRLLLYASVMESIDGGDLSLPKQKWNFDGISVQRVNIKGNISLFSLNGKLDLFRDHPVYGTGFHGDVGLLIRKILKDTANVEIYFGTKQSFKYWYAKIDVPVEIPIGGAISLKKLSGGVYSNMERMELPQGKIDYVPSEKTSLGFIAQVGLIVKSQKLFYGDTRFEIAFNKNNGVRYIQFDGKGKFFSDAKVDTNKLATIPSPVTAYVNMLFDNENDVFHANLRVYMNLINGIKGMGPDGMIGEAIIHSDPADWYIYIGRPSLPLGITIFNLAQAQAYFMAGTRVENMPVPPSEVASILKNVDLDFMKGENGIASGKGIGFGIRFKTEAGVGQNKGFVYAYFNAGAGVDILLKNYGSVQCVGRPGPIGINGWYASGQGYAYLTGRIGVRVKKSMFDIMSVSTALLLQAKMPNPTWLQGNIAARYSILGGLVKGKVNVGVTLGEECVIQTNGSELNGISMIGDIKPSDGDSEIDVFAAPQVSFNTNIGKEFGMMNLTDQYGFYRVSLDHFQLLNSENKQIAGTIQWNQEKDLATFRLMDILPGNQKIKALVKIHIEKKSATGLWENLNEGVETKEAIFSSGDEPKSVSESNILYSYPAKNQYNFHKSEYNQGYIKLKVGQPKLFLPESDGNKWEYTARFKTTSGDICESLVAYNESDALISFKIPDNLKLSSVYDLFILKKPVQSGSIDRNLLRNNILLSEAGSSDSLSVANTNLSGTVSSETEVQLFSTRFRTSLYPRFLDKLNNLKNMSTITGADKSLKSIIGLTAYTNETFDKYETEGATNDIGPFVFAEAYRNVPWIESHVYPLLYEKYGLDGIMLTRNINILGLIPLKAMTIYNTEEKGYLLDNSQSISKIGDVFIVYKIAPYVNSDFYDLLNKAAAMYLGKTGIPVQVQRLFSGRVDNLWRGSYPFKIGYRLPGVNQVTSSKDFSIVY